MKADDIRKAAVIGAGTMGHGIAQVLAMCGVEARLYDVDDAAVESALGHIRKNLDKGVERGKVTEDARAVALANLVGTTDTMTAIDGVQVVIEAAPERMDLKRKVFAQLGDALGPGVLLATNTSSLSVAAIADAARHPERVVGMHFFNPVHIMKLVEVVRHEGASTEAVQTAVDLARRMGKEPIEVTDAPGFASSRLGIAIGMEAIRMVEAGVASAADIDQAMVLGYGFPMGPLRLTDIVGLDIRLSIAEYLTQELGDRFEPPALLRDMVARGELGKKSGKGFYTW
ncbi:MAG: 3-hydroxyacyl-CoA dehydrogenase family protein [Planctomycetota bacterium]|nr:MAG: 3-hydroxyacyl-CoA dehydrogenase family protein [Planctomycetota bacterium]